MNRWVWKISFDQWMNFSKFLLSKDILNILDWYFFLNWRGRLQYFEAGILESIMYHNVKYHWGYRDLLESLRFSLRRSSVSFKCLFSMNKRCILDILENLEESQSLFRRSNLNLFKKELLEKESFQFMHMTTNIW